MKPSARRVLTVLENPATGSDGWVCGREINAPGVGGWRAAARLHELRQDGYHIDKQVCRCAWCRQVKAAQKLDGKQPTRIYAWRLAPSEVPA